MTESKSVWYIKTNALAYTYKRYACSQQKNSNEQIFKLFEDELP